MNVRFKTVQNFLQDTAENVIRAVARWLKSAALRIAIGAALLLIALFALANGLAFSMVELGLPLFASWLILTVVSGGAGVVLVKAGARKGITPAPATERRPGLMVRVVRSPRRRRPAEPTYRFRRRIRSPGRVRSK
jgi:hypothetical protein